MPRSSASGRSESMKVESWPIDTVVPYARNPRVNDGSVAAVAASLKEFGWRQPIVVDEEGVVIVGHTRLKAARMLGMTDVPVHVAKGLTPQQVKAYRIADNSAGSPSQWDVELLRLEVDDIGSALDLSTFNMDFFDHFEGSDAPRERPLDDGGDDNDEPRNECPKCGHRF